MRKHLNIILSFMLIALMLFLCLELTYLYWGWSQGLKIAALLPLLAALVLMFGDKKSRVLTKALSVGAIHSIEEIYSEIFYEGDREGFLNYCKQHTFEPFDPDGLDHKYYNKKTYLRMSTDMMWDYYYQREDTPYLTIRTTDNTKSFMRKNKKEKSIALLSVLLKIHV